MEKLMDVTSSTDLQGMTDLLNSQKINLDIAHKTEQELTSKFQTEPSETIQFDEFKKEIDMLSRQWKFDSDMSSPNNDVSDVSIEAPNSLAPHTNLSFDIDLQSPSASEESKDSANPDISDMLRTFDETPSKSSWQLENSNNTSSDFLDNISNKYTDKRLNQLTKEEESQRVIEDVLRPSRIEIDDDDDFIERQDEADEKHDLLEKIDLLRDILTEEGIQLDNIKVLDATDDIDEIRSTLRTLRRKNNRSRNTIFAEDVIMGFSYVMEELFDGKKIYFGRKPDLHDWHKTVNTKLRRMRPDTNEIAQNVTEGLGMGAGARIALELIPSMFIYSRQRRTQHDSHAINQEDVDNAITDITND